MTRRTPRARRSRAPSTALALLLALGFCFGLGMGPAAAPVYGSSLPKSVRKVARKLDKSLINVGRALLRVDQKSGKERASKSIRKAQKKLLDYLADPDLQCGYDELDDALAVLADPSFSPSVDVTPLTDETDAATLCIVLSTTFGDSHADNMVLLGSSKSFDPFEFETKIFTPLSLMGPFQVLKLRAMNGDIDVDQLRIFFTDDAVVSQIKNGISDVDSGEAVTFVLDALFIDYIRIRAAGVDSDPDRRPRLKFWGFFPDGTLNESP